MPLVEDESGRSRTWRWMRRALKNTVSMGTENVLMLGPCACRRNGSCSLSGSHTYLYCCPAVLECPLVMQTDRGTTNSAPAHLHLLLTSKGWHLPPFILRNLLSTCFLWLLGCVTFVILYFACRSTIIDGASPHFLQSLSRNLILRLVRCWLFDKVVSADNF